MISSASRRLFSAELVKINALRALFHDEDENVGAKIASHNNNETIDKFNKILLEFSASTCLVDLCAVDQPDQNARIVSPQLQLLNGLICISKFKPIELSDWARRARRKLWPYVILSLWLACTLHLSYYLYHQYVYDYYLFRLSRVRWLNHTQPPEVLRSYRVLEREDFLLEELRRRGDQLKQIGAPNMELSFVVESFYLHVMLACFLLYFIAFIYFAFKSPFDFYFVRNIFDIQAEQRRNERLVRAQAEKLIASISRWSRTLRNSSVQTHDGKLVSACSSGMIDCSTLDESLLCKQLNELLAVGLLSPLNQRAKWVKSWSPYYTWIMISSYVSGFIVSLEILALQIYVLERPINELNSKEWLIYLELLYLMITVQVSVAFYGSTLVFTCWDQLMLVSKLRKLLELTIGLNDLRFYGRKMLSKQSLPAPEQLNDTTQQANQTNRDILLVLMHYRIFVNQLVKLKRPLSFIAATAVFFMFLTPVLGRLHVAYFQSHSMQKMRWLLIMESAFIIIPVNIYLVPVCYLNKRCIDLYCELNSLLAQVTQISRVTETNQWNEHLTHDRHIIISLLRKELSHHDQLLRKLTVEFLGISFTYETLVQLHFYAGFIVLTIMGENLAQIREPTGTIFTDPLNLF